MRAYRKHRQTKRVHFHSEEGVEVWTYQVSPSFVSIRDPNGRKTLVSVYANFNDEHPTPQMVKDYIWRHLKPGRVLKTDPQNQDEAKESILNFFLGARGRQFETYYDANGHRRILKLRLDH